MKEAFQSLFDRAPCKEDGAIKRKYWTFYLTKFRYIGLNTDTCSDNINDYEYYMVMGISTFMLTALPKCWQLGSTIASQYNNISSLLLTLHQIHSVQVFIFMKIMVILVKNVTKITDVNKLFLAIFERSHYDLCMYHFLWL